MKSICCCHLFRSRAPPPSLLITNPLPFSRRSLLVILSLSLPCSLSFTVSPYHRLSQSLLTISSLSPLLLSLYHLLPLSPICLLSSCHLLFSPSFHLFPRVVGRWPSNIAGRGASPEHVHSDAGAASTARRRHSAYPATRHGRAARTCGGSWSDSLNTTQRSPWDKKHVDCCCAPTGSNPQHAKEALAALRHTRGKERRCV